MVVKGIITTIAGTGTAGSTGDGGLAINALLYAPTGVWVDTNNKNIYIADYGNSKIRMVTSTGIINTIAGGGSAGLPGSTGDGGPATSAQLNYPQGIALDMHGNVYIADYQNSKIRMVTSAGGKHTLLNTI